MAIKGACEHTQGYSSSPIAIIFGIQLVWVLIKVGIVNEPYPTRENGPTGLMAVSLAENFPRPAALQPAVDFWTRVYTEVDTRSGYIHDADRSHKPSFRFTKAGLINDTPSPYTIRFCLNL